MGDTGATDRGSDADSPAFEAVYTELIGLARSHFRMQAASHTLQPTALVHEAYLRVASATSDGPDDREHLLALASRAMRHILIDHARRKRALKRGGGDGQRVTISEVDSAEGEWDVLELDDAIEKLKTLDPRQAQIVEIRFFGGLSVEQTAEALGVSERTVYLDWKMARAWLWAELRGDGRG